MQITEEKILSEDLTLSEVLEIPGTLIFDPGKSVTLTTSRNVIVTGKLVMKPASPKVIHTIRFIDIDENKFVGGGMEVLDSDIGLWVIGKGRLDIEGSKKTPWTRAVAGIETGNTLIKPLAMEGWAVDDDVVILPTAAGASNYDERKIRIIDGTSLFVDKTTNHPYVDKQYTPEILNLTRNVRIEGTAGGRAHIFIHAQVVQNISYVAIRYMGPRKNQLSDNAKELIPGRYGLHFHHCEDGSRGSIVEGVVVYDTDNHAFVPHGSHGIQFTDCISYNTTEDAYWWDLGHQTHDTAFIRCVAAKVKYVPRSVDMNLRAIDTSDKVPTLGADGLTAGRGDGNKWIDGVIVGTTGDPHGKGGINWIERNEEKPEGVWEVVRPIIHNCNVALRIWQNTGLQHEIIDLQAYSNGLDIHLGAYNNNYTLKGGRCNGKAEFKAGSGDRQRIIGMEFNQVEMLSSALPSNLPMLFLNCKWNTFVDNVGENKHSADIVNCEGPVSVGKNTVKGETLRVQPKEGQPFKVTAAGRTNISPFAPTLWGDGTGLKGEYFSDPNFTNKVMERLDMNIAFGDWGNWIHYATPGPRLSVRWTGKLLAQFTEAYTFSMGGGGSMKLFINDKQVTGKINLTAGKLYDIKVEFFNNDNNVRGGANLKWNSPSLNLFSPGGEYIPQSQLYPGEATPPPPPPVNEKPTASAGPDAEITLPVDNVVLRGSGNDNDGTIVNYNWSKVNGGPASITAPGSPVTAVTGLTEGDYTFRLTVTDDKGATASDDCTVTVKPAPVINQPPSADAGPDIEYTLGVALEGKAEDIDGEVVNVLWEQVSGPEPLTIFVIDKLQAKTFPTLPGTYVFRFTVTDDKGASVSDEKVVIVN